MSNQVDERVVSMRFDNKHFESNVSTTMSTLDKLKQKLHLDGASKGLDNVNKAAKNVDMGGVGTAVDTVKAKFSAMEVVSVTALANITNSAVNAGKRIVSALTIDPVKTGFQEYETQMNAVQTILANTQSKGSTLDDVNKALDELNKYADLTIYNFTEMTRNIGTFTAAGVDLDTSVNAIQGIANLAAISGSTSQQASTAMYQLSQALASGTVKLMDWNSVVNAGMGGQVFQDALKETSELLGTGAEAAIKAEGSFRDSLTQGWLTAEVLTETLKKFTTSGANERVAEYTGLSKEAVEAALEEAKAQYGEAEAIEYASKALAAKSGKNADEIKETLELARTATDAATKVKTFTQLWDVMKEAAQSGWAQTWKIIVGDFEQAKALLTPLADFFTGVINKMSDARNNLLRGAFGNPFQALFDKLDAAGLGKIKEAIDGVNGMTRTLEEYQKVVNDVWRGNYHNAPVRYQLMEEAGYDDYAVIQDLVNLGYKHKITLEDVARSQERYGKKTTEATAATSDMSKALEDLTDEELRNLGFTDDEIKLLRELSREAKKAGMSIGEFIEQMETKDGRTLFIESFKNIGQGIVAVLTAIKDAWVEIFPPMSSIQLYNIIRGLNEFSQHLVVGDETANKLKRTLKGVFAIIDIVATILGGGLRIALKIIGQILGLVDLDILSVTAAIGDAIVAFRDWLDSVLDFTGVFKTIAPYIKNAVKAVSDWVSKNIDLKGAFEKVTNACKRAIDRIREWIDSLKNSKNLPQDIAKGIASGFSNVISFIGKALSDLGVMISNGFEGAGSSAFGKFLKGLWNGVKIAGQTLVELGKILIEKFNGVLTAHGFKPISIDIIAGFLNGLKEGATKVLQFIWNFGANILSKIREVLGIHSPSTEFHSVGSDMIAGLFNGLKEGASTVWTLIMTIGQKCIEIVKNLDIGTVIAGALAGGIVIATVKIAGAIKQLAGAAINFVDGIGDIFDGIGNVLDAVALKKKAEAIKTLAVAIGILVVALVVLTYIDHKKMWVAVGALGALVGIVAALAGVAFLLNKMGNISGSSATLLALTASLLLISMALKKLSTIKQEDAGRAISLLVTTIFSLMSMVAVLAIFTAADKGANLDKVGKMLGKMAIAMIIMVLVIKLASKLDSSEVSRGLAVVAAIELLFAGIIAVSYFAGEHGKAAGQMLLKMSVAMLIMVAVVKLAGKLKSSEIGKGLAFVIGVGIMFAALVAVSKFAGQHASKAGSMLLKMSIAMLLMIAVIKTAAKLDDDAVTRAIRIIAIIGVMFRALIMVTKSAGKNASQAGSMLLKMSVALLILTGVMFLLSLLKPDGLTRALIAIAVLEACFAGLIAVTKFAKGTKGMQGVIIGMAVAIALMGGILIALSCLDPKKVGVATIAMTALIGMFALLMYTSSYLKSGEKTWKRNLVTIAVLGIVIAALGGMIIALAHCNAQSVLSSAAALSLLLLSLSASMLLLSNAKGMKSSKLVQLVGVMALLAGVMAALGLVLAMMSALKATNVIPNALALSILLIAMTGVLAVLNLVKTNIGNAAKGALGLTLLAVPLLAFVGVLALMQNVQNAVKNATVLAGLATVMTLLLIPLSLIGVLIGATGGMALLGIVGLLAMAVPMLAFVGILALMQNIQNAMTNTFALIALMGALTDMLVVLAIVGPFALVGVTAVAALTALIVAVGVLAVAIGALFEKFPSLQDFLDRGLPVLIQLAGGIGQMIGAFIKGIATEILSILPMMGAMLSAFMIAATPFIEGCRSIDDTVVIGAGILAGAILAITVADLIASITSFLGMDFPTLGTKLSEFMNNASDFVEGLKELDPTTTDAAKTLAETILVLTATNLLDGIARLFGGSASLTDFGKELATFGPCLADYANSVSGLSPAALEAMKLSAEAGKLLAEMAASFPNTGGWLGAIMGENNADTFGAQLVGFGKGLKEYGETVQGIDTEAIQNSADAGAALVEVANAIPNTGGWIGKIMGENDIDTFGSRLTAFGKGLKDYGNSVHGLNVDAIEASIPGAKGLTDVAAALPNSGGWFGEIFGNNDIDAFGVQLEAFGKSLKNYGDSVIGLDTDAIAASVTAANSLNSLAGKLHTNNGFLTEMFGGGTTTLEDFGEQLSEFGGCISDYDDEVRDIDISAVTKSTEAVATLMSTVSTVSNGTLDTKKFSDFLNEFSNMGPHIDALVNGVAFVSAATFEKVVDTIEDMYELAMMMTDEGLSGGIPHGETLVAFGEDMKTFGGDLKQFSLDTVNVDVVTLKAVGNFVGTMVQSLQCGVGSYDSAEWAALGNNLVGYSESLVTFTDNLEGADITGTAAAVVETVNTIAELPFDTIGVGSDNMNSLVTSLKDLANVNLSEFANSFTNAKDSLSGAGETMMNALIEKIKSKFTDFVTIGGDFAKKLIEGFSEQESNVSSSLSGALDTAVTSIKGKWQSFYDAGSHLVDGFVSGISANTYKAEAQAAAMAEAAAEAAKEELDINSPSKVFRAIGYSVPEGFAMGIDRLSSLVTKSSDSMAKDAIGTVQTSIGRIVDLINSDIDSQPTIRPVLDLSNVRTGVDAIGSMLGGTSHVGVLANVGSISSMMNGRIQNGDNAEVVSAIKGLRKDISDMPRNTYTVGGITYDDGTNVSEAVKALVRATRIERRT